MPAYTLDQAQSELTDLRSAKSKILTQGQSYSIGGRSLNRGDLRWINEEIKNLAAIIARLERNGIRVRRAVPFD